MRPVSNNINIKNKRASFDYEFIDTYTAGIVLTGTEIKSIRQGKASLVDTFCFFSRGELWVKNMHIAEYFYGSYNNHTARRDRKLLLTTNIKQALNLTLLVQTLLKKKQVSGLVAMPLIQ
jgi:SsrA-binding protein